MPSIPFGRRLAVKRTNLNQRISCPPSEKAVPLQSKTTKYKTHMMKSKFFLALLLLSSIMSFAQTAKKPTIMVLPSDNWCTLRYYTKTFTNQGKKIVVYDYERAFREDIELGGVVSKIGEMLTDKGYSLKDCAQELKALNDRHVEEQVTFNSYGDEIAESPLDILKRQAKADLIIYIDWKVLPEKKGQTLNFTIESFDAYTNKRVATATGLGKPSKEMLPRMLENALSNYLDSFDKQMSNYYNDLLQNGREIRFSVRVWDTGEVDLNQEYNGEELLEVIDSWMYENTVGGAYNLSDATNTRANFEQVRIPFFDERQRAMDARSFATKLRKYLANSPYHLPATIQTRGLGEAIIIIGEK